MLLQAGATAAGTAAQTLKGAGLTAAKTAATQAVSGRRHILTQPVSVSALQCLPMINLCLKLQLITVPIPLISKLAAITAPSVAQAAGMLPWLPGETH